MEAIEENKNNSGDVNEIGKRSQDFRYKTIYPGSIDNFGKHLIGKLLTIELLNGKLITGRLRSYGMFDVMIMDTRTGQDIIIMKHAIAVVQGDLSVPRNTNQERR